MLNYKYLIFLVIITLVVSPLISASIIKNQPIVLASKLNNINSNQKKLILQQPILINIKNTITGKDVSPVNSATTETSQNSNRESNSQNTANTISNSEEKELTDLAIKDWKSIPPENLEKSSSSAWAGYAIATNLNAPQSGIVSYVKGDWVVPPVDCSSQTNSRLSIWVGIDGYKNSNTVEQIGTQGDCSSGTPKYYAWYETYPKAPMSIRLMKISPGDVINAQVEYVKKNYFRLTIVDVSTGKKVSRLVNAPGAQRSSAEWIVEQVGGQPLSNFGKVGFGNIRATLNGHTGTISDGNWQYDKIRMLHGSTISAQPTDLSTDGSYFEVNWVSA